MDEILSLGRFTQKEIFEIPSSLRKIIEQRTLINKLAKVIVEKEVKHIFLIGAGSSYHAGFAMSYMFNRITSIPTFTEFSMEFQYLVKPILAKEDCVIAISQSGETKDTIESIRIAKEFGCLTIGITNNPDSNLARISDHTINLNSGDENSVLATKTYVAQLGALAVLSLEIAEEKKSIKSEEINSIWIELVRIPDKVHSILPILHENIKKHSNFLKSTRFCFILGSGPDYATAMEAALKLKEGARIYGQAYSTAEFPHGPITLADSDTCIIAIIPHEEDNRKAHLLQLLKRIKERNAQILGVYEAIKNEKMPEYLDISIRVPNTVMDLQPIVMILAVQLLTLEIARTNGLNPDEPKFLTKVSNF
ncbi:MAG: SIS domain-containing protein [Candidatus Lokiarchaeota archaeon]|nr:SIS domain-containing protein [Candidatus Lokiarchaeota archaeon]